MQRWSSVYGGVGHKNKTARGMGRLAKRELEDVSGTGSRTNLVHRVPREGGHNNQCENMLNAQFFRIFERDCQHQDQRHRQGIVNQ